MSLFMGGFLRFAISRLDGGKTVLVTSKALVGVGAMKLERRDALLVSIEPADQDLEPRAHLGS